MAVKTMQHRCACVFLGDHFNVKARSAHRRPEDEPSEVAGATHFTGWIAKPTVTKQRGDASWLGDDKLKPFM